ncbi:MAG TPA: hypothetical protein VG818_02660 [Gemmatimonadaceae bacterium]|jgi:hypothetical protein|nr:hypothetical protein [Gemmatimonadaceae bacterium]
MIVRVIVPAVLLAAALVAPSAEAQQFEYTPGTAHYRVTSNIKASQAMMGQTSDIEQTGSQTITMAIARRAKDTLALDITLDSVTSGGTMGPAQGIEKMNGLKVQAFVSPNGAFYSYRVPSDTSQMAASLAEQIAHMLPRVPTAISKGATWADTVSGKVSQSGIEMTRQIISTYMVEGDTTIGGVKAWNVSRKSSATTSGVGAAQGQPMTLQGTSTGSGHVYLSASGSMLGSDGIEDVQTKITLTAQGMEVNVTTHAATTIQKTN